MKKILLHVFVFLLICTVLGSISASVSTNMTSNFAPKIMAELLSRLNNSETIVTDGNMMEAYMFTFNIDMLNYNGTYLSADTFEKEVKVSQLYTLNKADGVLQVTNIVASNKTIFKKATSMDQLLLIKNISMNVLIILIAIGMYLNYNKKKIIHSKTL